MRIREMIEKLMKKNSAFLCSFALVAATLTTNGCTYRWYQEQEPEGLVEFANRKKEKALR